MGWGSGTAESPYLVAPLDAIKTQASSDGTILKTPTTDSTSSAAAAASAAATAIVFINSDSGEGYTIIVAHSVGPLILENILAQPNVVAIV